MVSVARQNGQTYFAADEVIAALGGTVTRDGNGFKASFNNTVAAFGTDSRFGVVKDDLIEMLGEGQVHSRVIDLVKYATDASPYRMFPKVVVTPSTVDQVAKIFA